MSWPKIMNHDGCGCNFTFGGGVVIPAEATGAVREKCKVITSTREDGRKQYEIYARYVEPENAPEPEPKEDDRLSEC